MNEKTENELYGVETDMQQPAYEEELVLLPEEETDAKGEASDEENAEAGEMEIVLEDAPKEKQEQAVRVQEEPALRAADRKVFAMSDGTQQAVFYAEPVHCFDEETQCYTEIDNAFTAEADGRYYRNAKSHFTARFSREETNDELFRIEKGAYQLVVSLQKPMARRNRCPAPVLVRSGGAEEDGAFRAAEEAPAQAPACAGPELEAAEGDLVFSPDSGETGPVAAAEAAAGTEAPENTAFKDLPEDVIPRKETLLYAGAAEHADFAYEICGDRVKENIIIRERVPVYRYGFTLSCENLSAAFLEEERTLCLCAAETGAEVFRIPAPFMTDASGVRSDGVFYEVRDLPDGTISLAVIADSAWINAPERVFPVTVDPQVIVSGASGFATYSWTCGTMSQSSTHTISACTGSGSTCASKRMYLRIALPILPRNPRIQKAELTLRQKETTGECQDLHQIGLYQVTGSIQTGACTPAYNETPIDFERIKTGAAAYTFDVTALIDAAAATGAAYANLMVKLVNENSGCTNSIIWYGSTSGSTAPQLAITYDSSYGVQTSSGTHTHALGRFGSAAIDLRRGNLMFEAEDFSFGGKRMPVTIRHLYNSALAAYQYTANGAIGLHTANFSNMNAGKGWRLSCMQSITEKSVVHEGKRYSGYVYINESGTERYLRQGDTDSLKKCCETNGQCYEYYLHTATDGSGYTYDPCKRELYMGSETYLFDTAGTRVRR